MRFEKLVIGTISKVNIKVVSKYKEKFLNKIFTVKNFSMRESHFIINLLYAQKLYFFNPSLLGLLKFVTGLCALFNQLLFGLDCDVLNGLLFGLLLLLLKEDLPPL